MEISEMETNAQYFDCLCRTCMNNVEAYSHGGTTKPQLQWLSILDIIEECGDLRIAELLSDAVPQIVVQPSDELPKKICTECLQRLLSVYQFQQMCVQSDKQMHEVLSKERTGLKMLMLERAIKGETEIDEEDPQPLKDFPCSSTPENLQHLSIPEPLAEVTVQTIEPEAAQSSIADPLKDNTQLLEHCNDSQGVFEEFIKNEPIEDEANTEYSDGDTMHSTISVPKGEPIEHEDEEVNVTLSQNNCRLCNKSFKNRESLRTHLNNHKKKANNSKQYSFDCHLCSKLFKKRPHLSRHLDLAHSKELQRYTCDFCNKSFGTSYGLRRHIRIHTGERPHLCPECGKTFTTRSNLAEHRTIHSEDKAYECPYCPLRFASKANMANHKKSHERIKPHQCDICGKNFRWKSQLVPHKLSHSKEKPLKCDFCEKWFAYHFQLVIHTRVHTGEKPYTCKYCELTYTTSNALMVHLRRHLGVNVYRCKFCPLAFRLDSEMRLHLTSHKNEDPKTRERNLKALQEEEAKLVLKFSKEKGEGQSTEEQQQNLSNKEIEQQSTDIPAEQRTTYAQDKPFECPYCPLRFSYRSGVSTHIKIHEGSKPHKCSICGKAFRIPADLRRHNRVHTEEKPHKCDQCEKQFAHMQQLKAHKRYHTGEKPFKCKYCERGYVALSLLNWHLRSHLGKNIYRCKFCPLAFPSSAEMRLHLPSHKNEDSETRERNLKALQEEEAKLKLNSSKEISKGQSTEEQQQQKLSNKEIEQPSTE